MALIEKHGPVEHLDPVDALTARIEALEREVATLKEELAKTPERVANTIAYAMRKNAERLRVTVEY